jgi:hypothetical protein
MVHHVNRLCTLLDWDALYWMDERDELLNEDALPELHESHLS